jgi:ABC-type nitrate/sulfonate/bicarbonate transport system ATPase subunit
MPSEQSGIAEFPGMNVIEAAKLNVVFNATDKPVVALQDINLTVAAGDFVALIGPSGCGKTTLLRAIADLAPLTSGSLALMPMAMCFKHRHCFPGATSPETSHCRSSF